MVGIVKVVVVVSQADWQAANNEGRQVSRLLPPLLFGVALDQLLVNIAANQGNGLFFQVGWLLARHFLALLVNFSLSFGWRLNPPHLGEGVHIKGEVVNFTVEISNW